MLCTSKNTSIPITSSYRDGKLSATTGMNFLRVLSTSFVLESSTESHFIRGHLATHNWLPNALLCSSIYPRCPANREGVTIEWPYFFLKQEKHV